MPEETQAIHDPAEWEDTRVPMHAHRCMACAAKGVSTVWVHGDDQRGVVAAHKCPTCGEVQWKKWMVEIGQLPGHATPQKKGNQDLVLGYIVFALGIAIMGYIAFLYVRAHLAEKKGTV
jgi:hypothetical protein